VKNPSQADRFTADREQVSWRMLDGEAVLIHLETTHYYSLNASGTVLWQRLLEGAYSLDELVETLAAHFEMEPLALRDDVLGLMAEMQREGLVRHGG
jgi:hypothetical protein